MKADETLGLTVELVAAYVANNSLPVAELHGLLVAVHAAFSRLGQDSVSEAPQAVKVTPAQVRRSVTHEALISFEDGKPYKTLRRHLGLRGLSPEEYRAKWGLPADYAMTAPIYSQQRSALARTLGLGRKRETAAPEPEVVKTATAPKRRGRRKEPAA